MNDTLRGALRLSAVMVMMTAIIPSLKASGRLVPTVVSGCCGFRASPTLPYDGDSMVPCFVPSGLTPFQSWVGCPILEE